MTALFSIILKEYRQTFRDKRMLWLLLMAPLVQLILLGYAVNLEVDRVPTIIADEDHTPESRRLAADLTASRAFKYRGHVPTGKHRWVCSLTPHRLRPKGTHRAQTRCPGRRGCRACGSVARER